MSRTDPALDVARRVLDHALANGAQEGTVSVSEGTSAELSRRDGKVEQASEAVTRRLGLQLLVDDRWSTHSTSDLRPDALTAFVDKAIAATRYLEPDADRRLPDPALCGRGATDAELDTLDPAYADWTPEDRAAWAESLERAFDAHRGDDFVSATVYVADGSGQGATVASHGFADTSQGAWFSAGGTVTLADGSRRPEGGAGFGARYRSDIPDVDAIAADAFERAREAIGSGPVASGAYPMILLNRVAGRILGTLGGPLSGGALHQGRSCLAGKLGEAIGSTKLTILDDPTVPRGLGSTAWDGDLMVARPRTIVEDGVLRSYYVDVFHGRRLGMDPTTGGRTNWVLPAGEQSWQELAKAFPKAILVTGFLGGNANSTTGDFSFGIRGRLLEGGVPTKALSEMNVSGNVLSIFHKLSALADDPWAFSSVRSPTLVFEDVSFSGT